MQAIRFYAEASSRLEDRGLGGAYRYYFFENDAEMASV